MLKKLVLFGNCKAPFIIFYNKRESGVRYRSLFFMLLSFVDFGLDIFPLFI
nr:MAG TPA: hypothetical protein [Caudoviricetes sp.]